jgi:hypothetical protein
MDALVGGVARKPGARRDAVGGAFCEPGGRRAPGFGAAAMAARKRAGEREAEGHETAASAEAW